METVLVVEDSRPMQRTLQRLFESDGLAVQIAADGLAGIESFRKQTPSVVVLDLKLPKMPGNEVWGYENYPVTRTVDNHVLRLRQKLEPDPVNPRYFLTMHGTGYKFAPGRSDLASEK